MDARCLFCDEPFEPFDPDHAATCDGRQGGREAPFGGDTYEPARDGDRLFAQLERVRAALRDHNWHTLPDLAARTGAPEASISARLRDLRKPRFGGYQVERRYVAAGLWAYRIADRESA